MNDAYLSLGSNIGDRLYYLGEAVRLLHKKKEINVVNISSIYETDPVGYEEQDLFLNMVIQLKTSFTPFELLQICQHIEENLGRKRIIHWGPRTVDLDILLFNQENIVSENLFIPHPRIEERAFVMIPLIEIHPTVVLPNRSTLLKDSLKLLQDKKGVRVWKKKNGEDVFELFES